MQWVLQLEIGYPDGYYRLKICYNHGHNILRLFDILPNVPFTTSETKRDYY